MIDLIARTHRTIGDIRLWLAREDGATSIEYGLMAAGIGLAIMITIFAIGDELSLFFNALQGQLAQRSESIY